MKTRTIAALTLAAGVAASVACPAARALPAPGCAGRPAYQAPAPPTEDAFYTPPDPLPAGPAGTVIRSRPTCMATFYMGSPYAAWQVMYLSTGTEDANGVPSDTDAVPVADVATIIAPLGAASPPLVSYQTPEDSDSMLAAPPTRSARGSAAGTPRASSSSCKPATR